MSYSEQDERAAFDVRKLKPDRAKRALYVDFEGEGVKSDGEVPQPVILGIYCRAWRPSYRLQILEPELRLLANAGFQAERLTSMEAGISSLIRHAEVEDRDILFFSQHEQEMVDRFCKPETSEAFRIRSGNAKLLLSRWARRAGRPKCHSLDDFCRMIDRLPNDPPKPSVAEAIRRIREACRNTNRWRSLDPSKQTLARKLLAYNKEDCLALYQLTKKAANYLNHE